jgi:hypothetical protein
MGLSVQLGLLAQRGNFDDWANILFVAVMALLWLVGSVVKAVSKKTPPREQPGQENAPKVRRLPGESWQERLVRKAQEMQRRIEEEAGLREPGKPTRPTHPAPRQAPRGKITIRSDSKGESLMVYEPAPSQPPTEREHHAARQREAQQAVAAAGQYAAKQATPVQIPIAVSVGKLEPIMENLSGVMAEPPKPLEPGNMPRKPAPEPAGFEVAAVIDYSDPDALKKAVLHYEILGRPLALRDTPDQTSPF